MRDSGPDRELVDRLRAGEGAAVADLEARYGSKIFQLALRYVRLPEDAEEVTQDVLMKVFRKIPAFRGDAALSSWIYRITFNTAMSRLRASRAARVADARDERQTFDDSAAGAPPRDEVADWSALADHQLLRAEMRQALVRALKDLPLVYRAPVLLRDVQGLSTEEAAAVLGVKTQTLKSRLHRGRLILRGRLGEFAGGLALRPV